jgi:hypothetical protein
MFVPTSKLEKELINDAIGSHTTTFAGVLNGAVMGLFTNDPILSNTTVLEDLTPPNNPSYAVKVIGAWQGPFREVDDKTWRTVSPEVVWGLGSDTTPQTITGYALLGSDSVTLLGAEKLPTPVSLLSGDNVLIIIAEVQPRPNADWGSATVVT